MEMMVAAGETIGLLGKEEVGEENEEITRRTFLSRIDRTPTT